MNAPFSLEIDLAFAGPVTDAPFDEFLDDVVDALAAVPREADYVASARRCTATFTLAVPDRSEDALIAAVADLRAALRTATGAGARWNRHEVTATRTLAPSAA